MTDETPNTEPETTPVTPVAPDATEPTSPAPATTEADSAPDALTPEAAAKELARARKEAATYREKLRKHEEAAAAAAEAKRRKELTIEQRAKETEEKAQQAIEAAEARATAAERRAALTGHVADAVAALKLLDPEKHLNDDGTVNTDALLADYPFLKPADAKATPAGIPNPRSTTPKDPSKMTDAEWYAHKTQTAKE